MTKVRITQVKSKIDRSQKQKDTLAALGLKKMHQSVEKELTPAIKGMIDKVHHLVSVETLDA